MLQSLYPTAEFQIFNDNYVKSLFQSSSSVLRSFSLLKKQVVPSLKHIISHFLVYSISILSKVAGQNAELEVIPHSTGS